MTDIIFGAIEARLLAEELWELVVKGIEQGELTSPTTIEGAFIAGVMASMAALSAVREAGEATEEVCK